VFDARTRRSFLQLAAVASGCAFAVDAAAAQPKELVRESIYNYIIVSRSGSVVSFRRMENGASISAIDMSRPSYQVIDYAKFLFAGALVDPNPSNVLSIGLGAGSFNRLFNLLYPDAELTTVEIDPMIRDLAVEFTDFQESPKNKVVIEDGRRFLRRSAEYWNWIVVDAFVKNSQYPPHMATREFFSLIAGHLSPGGILLINVLQGSKLFDCMIATISSVFPRVASLDVPEEATPSLSVRAMTAHRLIKKSTRLLSPPCPCWGRTGWTSFKLKPPPRRRLPSAVPVSSRMIFRQRNF